VEYVIIVNSKGTAEQILKHIENSEDGPTLSPAMGLGGSAMEWVIYGALAVQAVVQLLKAIFPFIEARQVRSIKMGDVEVLRPRPEDMDRILGSLQLHGPDQAKQDDQNPDADKPH
jgi:hypothetical protein